MQCGCGRCVRFGLKVSDLTCILHDTALPLNRQIHTALPVKSDFQKKPVQALFIHGSHFRPSCLRRDKNSIPDLNPDLFFFWRSSVILCFTVAASQDLYSVRCRIKLPNVAVGLDGGCKIKQPVQSARHNRIRDDPVF